MRDLIQRLFSIPQTEPLNEQAAPAPGKVPRLNELPPGLYVGKLSDIGRERERNEDAFYVFEATLNDDNGADGFGLFIVADGMGGHERGEVASSLAARSTADFILRQVYLPELKVTPANGANQTINEVLTEALSRANDMVHEEVPDGGTTLTAVLVMGQSAYVAHVGDSRAYLWQPGALKKITKDHSLAQYLAETGQASAEEAAQVENVLYKAIGQGSDLEIDTYMQHFPPAASLLVCSDGLWNLVADATISEVLSTSSTPQQACQRLIDLANQNGGRDNITVVVVTMGVNGDTEKPT